MDALAIASGVTIVGTAVLTVGAVIKLAVGPMNDALRGIKESVDRLEIRVEQGEAKRESDVKEIWKHLAQRREP